MQWRAFTVTAVAALALAAAPRAEASAIFLIGNIPQNDENVLLSSGVTGDPVFGATNQTELAVQFTSTTDTLVEPSSGQARIESSTDALENIAITVPGGFYTSLIFNLFIGGAGAPPPTTASIVVTTNDLVQTFSFNLGIGGNFLTIVATGGERILATAITSLGGFSDIRQIRLGGAALQTPTSVPEPASLVLLGSGLMGFAYLRRRRKR